MGFKDEVPVGGLEDASEAGDLFHNKNRICDVKMHINVKFLLKFCQNTYGNTVSHAKILARETVCAGHSKER